MPAAVSHHNALVILAASPAHGLAITAMRARQARHGCPLWRTLRTGNPRRTGLGMPHAAPPWCQHPHPPQAGGRSPQGLWQHGRMPRHPLSLGGHP